jgi:hypothetical protein
MPWKPLLPERIRDVLPLKDWCRGRLPDLRKG